MYSSFFKLKKWGKKTAAARRHNCAVLPKKKLQCELPKGHADIAVFFSQGNP